MFKRFIFNSKLIVFIIIATTILGCEKMETATLYNYENSASKKLKPITITISVNYFYLNFGTTYVGIEAATLPDFFLSYNSLLYFPINILGASDKESNYSLANKNRIPNGWHQLVLTEGQLLQLQKPFGGQWTQEEIYSEFRLFYITDLDNDFMIMITYHCNQIDYRSLLDMVQCNKYKLSFIDYSVNYKILNTNIIYDWPVVNQFSVPINVIKQGIKKQHIQTFTPLSFMNQNQYNLNFARIPVSSVIDKNSIITTNIIPGIARFGTTPEFDLKPEIIFTFYLK